MKFEYLSIYTGGMPFSQDSLNELGADGWEMVTVAFDTAYFKRQKAEKAKKEEKPVEEKPADAAIPLAGEPVAFMPVAQTVTTTSGAKSTVQVKGKK